MSRLNLVSQRIMPFLRQRSRPTFPFGVAASVFAFAIALIVVAQLWPLTQLHLKRSLWYGLLVGCTIACHWSMKFLIHWIAKTWRRESRASQYQMAVTCVAIACSINFAAEYRLFQKYDNIWIHTAFLQNVLKPLLIVSQLLVSMLIVCTGCTVLLRVLPRETISINRPFRHKWSMILSILIGTIAIALMVTWFVQEERTAHYWDFSNYWLICSAYADTLSQAPSYDAAEQLIESVRSSEYTLLPALAPSMLMQWFGDSRLSYELSVSVVYGGLIVFCCLVAIRKTATATNLITTWYTDLFATTLVVALPLIWAPTLRGYLDLGGVAIALFILGVTLSRPVSAFGWQSVVSIGIGLAMLTLFRRWYSFWVVAFFAAIGLEAAFLTIGSLREKASRTTILRLWTPIIAMGLIALGIVLSFAWQTVKRIATTNYADSYTAYKSLDSSWVRLDYLLTDIGYGYFALFLVAAITLISSRETRRVGVFAIAMLVTIHCYFHRIQDTGWHHRMLYAPSFLIVVGLAGVKWLQFGSGMKKVLVLSIVLIPYVVFAVCTFAPQFSDFRLALRPFTPRSPTCPEVRSDIESLLELSTYLHNESVYRNTSFCVLASSAELNQTHVLTVHRSMGLVSPRPVRQRMVTELDKVNGFPQEFFECGIVAVANPVQIHMRSDEQQVIQLLANQLSTGTGLGAAFTHLPGRYEFVKGIAVTVYCRTRPYSTAEILDFQKELQRIYPDRPMIFQPNREVPAWPTGMTLP